MPNIDEILDTLQELGVLDEWSPAETIESGGGTIPKTSSKGIVRASDNTIIELGPFGRIMAQYAMRDRAAARAAAVGTFALDLAAAAIRDLEDFRGWNLQSGRLYLPFKYVLSGLEVSVGQGRSLSIAAGEAVHGGYRRAYAERPNAVTVPPNPSAQTAQYVLWLDNSGEPFLSEGQTVPEGGLGLALVRVLPENTEATFAGALTDIRPMASVYHLPAPRGTVSLSTPYPNPGYSVFLHLEGASGPDVHLVVSAQARNAFTVENHGTADDVVVRWLTVYLGRF